MRVTKTFAALCASVLISAATMAGAQDTTDSLQIYFDLASARIAPDQVATLDQAARLYRDGQPYVMVVAGNADRTGAAEVNLALSLARAQAVAAALAGRGIPIERLQVLGRGVSELPVETDAETPEPRNRVVDITWR